MKKVSVCCIKWGDLYSYDYVNYLFHKVQDNLSYDFDFYCITDDSTGLESEIKVLDLDLSLFTAKMTAIGCYPKLIMFKDNLLPADQPTLFIDLDVLVLGSLDAFFDQLNEKGGIQIIREWTPMLSEKLLPLKWRRDRGGNSSVVTFIPREQSHLFEIGFMLKDKVFDHAHNDQKFI